MSKKISLEPKENLEIIVSTYWPTKIIKSITIRDLTADNNWRDSVTIAGKEAKYLYEQLKVLYEQS